MKKTGKLIGVCNCICHCGLKDCFTNHEINCEHCSDRPPVVLNEYQLKNEEIIRHFSSGGFRIVKNERMPYAKNTR